MTEAEMRERYGLHTLGQSLLMARRLIEAGTTFVQVNWPSVANGDPETSFTLSCGPVAWLRDSECVVRSRMGT